MLTAKRKKEIDLIIKNHLNGGIDAEEIADSIKNDDEWKYFDKKCFGVEMYD